MDNVARFDVPATSALRRIDGTMTKSLQRAEITRLKDAGWRPPESFTVRARDGVTELRGILWRPASTASIPVTPSA